ncbi:hypothetical protein BCR41DRAFT_345528 [Lobosporangium transversale]|uniref:Uncharacterized protein n=1 Tax=Lobosporangium transversale TaxID=64571 RepID=A0A1Y2H1Y2_9FUNG|nr:hypothetical protein BCR41DRAFT_345528 [Lobosporangium transversale]ORZ28567.1 hypothetical protein BCR41DRAFT_345528 [Lobosporangium transversale]|eukprot:XP_021886252.1 hypothetical protein BCR41DRAFT_345528 [Lobosporangium transversale]
MRNLSLNTCSIFALNLLPMAWRVCVLWPSSSFYSNFTTLPCHLLSSFALGLYINLYIAQYHHFVILSRYAQLALGVMNPC